MFGNPVVSLHCFHFECINDGISQGGVVFLAGNLGSDNICRLHCFIVNNFRSMQKNIFFVPEKMIQSPRGNAGLFDNLAGGCRPITIPIEHFAGNGKNFVFYFFTCQGSFGDFFRHTITL